MFPSFQTIQRLGSSWCLGQGNSHSCAVVAVKGSAEKEAQAQGWRCWRQPTYPELNPNGLGLPPSGPAVPAQPAQWSGINIPGHRPPHKTLNPEGVLLRGRAAFSNSWLAETSFLGLTYRMVSIWRLAGQPVSCLLLWFYLVLTCPCGYSNGSWCAPGEGKKGFYIYRLARAIES